jgi:gliding motility-associated-like protein
MKLYIYKALLLLPAFLSIKAEGCTITSLTAIPGPVFTSTLSPATNNTYQLTGSITFNNPPASGTLVISSSCGGSHTYNAPFPASGQINFTFNLLPANSATCTVTAVFSADPGCVFTTVYTAPDPLPPPPCAITTFDGSPAMCDFMQGTTGVFGNLTFDNPPMSGELQILIDGVVSWSVPYPFGGIVGYGSGNANLELSDGQQHIATVIFTSDPGCTASYTYTAYNCFYCTSNGPVCAGSDLNLLACDLHEASGYPVTWTGPNGFTSNLMNPVIQNASIAASGTYTMSVYFPSGTVSTATTEVMVNPLPVANAGNDLVTCIGGSVNLSGQGGAVYSWSPSISLSNATIANPIASPVMPTTYTLTVTSAEGCTDTDEMNISLVDLQNASVSTNTTICQGASALLIASGGLYYSWSPITGLSNAAVSSPLASPSQSTIYSVSISVPGCTSEIRTVAVTVLPLPDVTVSADTICPGQTAVLLASGAGSYYWPAVNASGASLTVHPNATAVYTVVGTQGGCSASTSGTVVVVPLPDVSFSTSPQQPGGDYVITAESHSLALYNPYWTINSSDTIVGQHFIHDFVSEGIYTVCLHAENALACKEVSCKEVILKSDWTFYIPNSFSPNGDGKNDVFYCYGTNFSGYELQIFDRWGQLLYKSTDRSEGWDGLINGKPAKPDIYIYKVKIADEGGSEHLYRGHLSIIR